MGKLPALDVKLPVKSAVVIFGNLSVPSKKHSEIFEDAALIAKDNNSQLFIYGKPDSNGPDRLKEFRQAFPRYARSIRIDENIETLESVLTELSSHGFTNVSIFPTTAQSNPLSESQENEMFPNGVTFQNWSAENAEARLIEAIESEDFITFMKNSPFNTRDKARSVFNGHRKALGLKESTPATFRPKFDKEPSEKRERFFDENVLTEGDDAIIKKTNEKVSVKTIGCNYIIVENSNGASKRLWPHDLRKP